MAGGWLWSARTWSAALLVALVAYLALWTARRQKQSGGFVRILHQQYKTANQSFWPPEWRALSASWRELHPGWEYRFWTDEDEERLFREKLPEFLELYRQLPACRGTNIVRADLSSYALLYVYGGVYADLDTAPFRNLDEVIEAAAKASEAPPAILVNIERPEGDDEVRGIGGLDYPFSLDNDLMIATAPGHPFFYGLLKSIASFVAEHNSTVCGKPKVATYDLMYITAWGRLSIFARAWTEKGPDEAGLRFLEALYLRERSDASFALAVVHLLSKSSLSELQAHPPPRALTQLRKWLERRLRDQEERPNNDTQLLPLPLPDERFGALQAWRQAPDLLILPAAASPAELPKAELRREVLRCKGNAACFRERLAAQLRQEFSERRPEHNLLVVVNHDGGIWQGSWGEAQRAQYVQDFQAAQAA